VWLAVFGFSLLLLIQFWALKTFYTREAELEAGYSPRYSQELRDVTSEFLEILRKAESIDDPAINKFVEENEHRHVLFGNVAVGLARLKFDEEFNK